MLGGGLSAGLFLVAICKKMVYTTLTAKRRRNRRDDMNKTIQMFTMAIMAVMIVLCFMFFCEIYMCVLFYIFSGFAYVADFLGYVKSSSGCIFMSSAIEVQA